jgi:hypothetical protein
MRLLEAPLAGCWIRRALAFDVIHRVLPLMNPRQLPRTVSGAWMTLTNATPVKESKADLVEQGR